MVPPVSWRRAPLKGLRLGVRSEPRWPRRTSIARGSPRHPHLRAEPSAQPPWSRGQGTGPASGSRNGDSQADCRIALVSRHTAAPP
ncbi:unnamed protein product [Gadus morhua 'NCC']